MPLPTAPPSWMTLLDTNSALPKLELKSLTPLAPPEATTEASTPVISLKELMAAAMLATVAPEVKVSSREPSEPAISTVKVELAAAPRRGGGAPRAAEAGAR